MRVDDDPPGSGPDPPVAPAQDELPVAAVPHPALAQRIVALIEVLLCSDYPTQIALAATFGALGYGPSNGKLGVGFVAALSLLDTALLVGLMVFFLYAHGERPRDVFLGRRPVSSKPVRRPLIFVALTIRISGATRFAPHRREQPAAGVGYMPRDAWLFALSSSSPAACAAGISPSQFPGGLAGRATVGDREHRVWRQTSDPGRRRGRCHRDTRGVLGNRLLAPAIRCRPGREPFRLQFDPDRAVSGHGALRRFLTMVRKPRRFDVELAESAENSWGFCSAVSAVSALNVVILGL